MLKVTVTRNELYDYLRVEPGYDDSGVNLAFAAAKDEARLFLNTDFSTLEMDVNGGLTTIENEAPAAVKAWVFNRTSQLYENRGAGIPASYGPLQPFRVYPFRG